MSLPKARTKLANRYKRVVYEDGQEVVQFLEPRPSGNWTGWEVYEDGSMSDMQVFAMDVLPIGYVRDE